jgi:FKBP-type peptidyl-prolyl cis-trans isomerase
MAAVYSCGIMTRLLAPLGMALVVALAGCRSKEAAEPAGTPAPGKDEAALQREQWFGPQVAADKAVQWRDSGLGIRILAPGEGPAPKPADRVRVQYIGRLKDGMVFGDTRSKGKPADFTVYQLIPGWAAGMSSLKPGGKAVFYVPPRLGYGDMKVAGIPPSSGLIFEVELIAVNPDE